MLIGPKLFIFRALGGSWKNVLLLTLLSACVAWKREITESWFWFVDFITHSITYLKKLYGTVNILHDHSILYAVRNEHNDRIRVT